ncbi:hypothetical protein RFI_38444, partial [Reticulomyxa filosa]
LLFDNSSSVDYNAQINADKAKATETTKQRTCQVNPYRKHYIYNPFNPFEWKENKNKNKNSNNNNNNTNKLNDSQFSFLQLSARKYDKSGG